VRFLRFVSRSEHIENGTFRSTTFFAHFFRFLYSFSIFLLFSYSLFAHFAHFLFWFLFFFYGSNLYNKPVIISEQRTKAGVGA